MFDLRYHVASLAAVFVALLVGILVGVGISGRVDETERDILRNQLHDAESRLEAAGERRANLVREQKASSSFAERAYPLLIEDRLRDKRIVVVVVGSPGDELGSINRTLDDAGGHPLRLRALKVPIDAAKLDPALAGKPALAQYQGSDALGELGRALAGELVTGGQAPLWDALSSRMVEEQRGTFRRAADGVVVARSTKPQRGDTARLLAGLYKGLAESGVPAVGVEETTANPSAVQVWDDAGLSTVDDIDKRVGRLALALLLAGADSGNYGLNEAEVVPRIEPLPARPGG